MRDRDPLLDPPPNVPSWFPTVDDPRSVGWLWRWVAVVLVVGLGAWLIRGADRPADPQLIDEHLAAPDASSDPRPSDVDEGIGGADGVAPTAPGAPEDLVPEAPAQVPPALEPPGDPSRGELEGFGEVAVYLTDAEGTVIGWCVLHADEAALRQQGLMDVTDLRGYDGMLFTWAEEVDTAFFMFDTPMPLDIAWFGAGGELVSTVQMEPCLDRPADQCPRYRAGEPFLHALEVPLGTLSAAGVGTGTELAVGGACAPRRPS